MASVIGRRTPPASSPYREIKLYPVAANLGLPRTTQAIPTPLVVETRLFGVLIVYKLFPNTIQEAGEARCVFYVAYNTHSKRNEFVVGPACLDEFGEKVDMLAVAAGNFFGLTGYTSNYQTSTAAMVDRAFSGDMVGVLEKFGQSWAEALQDPGWWIMAVGAVASTAALPASTAARVKNPTSFPAVARALRTQDNLQGINVTRGVQLLEQPTVFRHTITADVPPASFARISRDGIMNFSSAGKAHYGPGVYAWPANATKIGARWIDIEVPALTAAELISTPNGSWYRLIGPTGETLNVRVVGHNFTPQEVALGKSLIEP